VNEGLPSNLAARTGSLRRLLVRHDSWFLRSGPRRGSAVGSLTSSSGACRPDRRAVVEVMIEVWKASLVYWERTGNGQNRCPSVQPRPLRVRLKRRQALGVPSSGGPERTVAAPTRPRTFDASMGAWAV
jgi:hypothetical protein